MALNLTYSSHGMGIKGGQFGTSANTKHCRMHEKGGGRKSECSNPDKGGHLAFDAVGEEKGGSSRDRKCLGA